MDLFKLPFISCTSVAVEAFDVWRRRKTLESISKHLLAGTFSQWISESCTPKPDWAQRGGSQSSGRPIVRIGRPLVGVGFPIYVGPVAVNRAVFVAFDASTFDSELDLFFVTTAMTGIFAQCH
jgi:hypothetical protein